MPNRKTRSECGHREQAAALRELLRQARRDKHLSQQELATIAGVSLGTIRTLEGTRSVDPSFFTVLAVARCLDLRLDDVANVVQQTIS